MAEQPSRQRRSWRDSSSTSPAAAKGPAKRRQVFVLLAVMFGLLGILIAWALIPARVPAPYLLPIVLTAYEDRHLPPNALADQDREALLAGEYFPSKAKNLYALQKKTQLEQELNDLKSIQKNEALILYLSGLVLVDGSGEVCLLPGDANVDRPETWIKLQEVLQKLQDCPARHKLLILDVMRPLADPRLGMLADDVGERVEALLERVADKDRLVLCACAPGQTAQASEELRRSVFGYYVEQGLRGPADASGPDGKPDRRVTVRELAHYVAVNVDRWAKLNRDTHQTPKLLGEGKDFELRVVETQPPVLAETASSASYPDWLQKAWARRDRWWDTQTYRLAPRAFRRLEASLSRAESLWRGGLDAAAVQAEMTQLLEPLERQALEIRIAVPQPFPHSLALAVARGEARSDPALAETLKKLLEKLNLDARSKKAEEVDKTRIELAGQFHATFKGKPSDLAWTAFQAAVEDPAPRADTIQFLHDLVRRVQPEPQQVESLFFGRLTELADQLKKDGQALPPERIRGALRVVRDGETVAACDPRGQGGCDPRLFAWVQQLLETAAQHRHEAEVMFFSPGYSSPAKADELFKQAGVEYQAIKEYESILHDAYHFHDQAVALLPGLIPYLMHVPEPDRHLEKAWRGAAQLVLELDPLLSRPATDTRLATAISEVQQKTETLRGFLNVLTQRFSGEVPKQLARAKRAEADIATLVDLEALLAVPWLRAKERAEVFSAARKLGRRLQEKTQEQQDPPGQPRDFDSRLAQRREQERALERAALALDLLRLGGIDGLSKLTDELQRVRSDPAKSPLAALGHSLRLAWKDELGTQLRKASDPVTQDRLSRAFQPFDEEPILNDPEKNPHVLLAKEQSSRLSLWLGDRLAYERQELRGLVERPDDPLVQFYAEAAGRFAGHSRSASVQFLPVSENQELNLRETRVRNYRLRLSVTVPPGTKATTEILPPTSAESDWLLVSVPPDKSMLVGSGPFDVPLTIQLKPDAEKSATAPKGFLVQARVNGRTFHHRVATPSLPLPLNKRLELFVSADPREPNSALTDLALRPNVRQSFHVYVRNPTDQPRKVLAVVQEEGNFAITAQSAPVVVGPGGKPERLSFPSGPAPAAGGKPADMPEVRGGLQVSLLDADTKGPVLDLKNLRVHVRRPRDYVEASAQYIPGEQNNKLTVRVKATYSLDGPPCHVELVLSPGLIPGFLKAERQRLNGELLAAGQEIELMAENLQFSEERPEQAGLIALHIDGYERALLLRVPFPARGLAVSATHFLAPRLTPRAPEAIRPGDPYLVHLEADNAPGGATLEVLPDKENRSAFIPKQLPRDRDQRIGFTTAEGALVLESSVKDWTIPFPTKGALGRWVYHVRMLKDNLEVPGTRKTVTVSLDDTKPTGVRFLSVGRMTVPPKELSPRESGLVPVTASGEDPESSIREVTFFEGVPINGKRPETGKSYPAAMDPKTTNWIAKVFLPPNRSDLMKLSVEFVNGVGEREFDTVTLLPPSAGSGAEVAGTGSIQGAVVEFSRPQPNQDVTLQDEKGKKLGETKTDGAGRFRFDNLAAGNYLIVAEKVKSAGKVRDQALIALGTGETKSTRLDLR